jgi:hypothetical protein
MKPAKGDPRFKDATLCQRWVHSNIGYGYSNPCWKPVVETVVLYSGQKEGLCKMHLSHFKRVEQRSKDRREMWASEAATQEKGTAYLKSIGLKGYADSHGNVTINLEDLKAWTSNRLPWN